MQFSIVFEWFNREQCIDSAEVKDIPINNVQVVVNRYVESINNLGYKLSQVFMIPME